MQDVIYTTTVRDSEHAEPRFYRMDCGNPKLAIDAISKFVRFELTDPEIYINSTANGFMIEVHHTSDADGERKTMYFDITRKLA